MKAWIAENSKNQQDTDIPANFLKWISNSDAN